MKKSPLIQARWLNERPLPVGIQVVTNLFVLKMNVIGIGKFVPIDQDRILIFKHELKPC
jgi:hypothetical protein